MKKILIVVSAAIFVLFGVTAFADAKIVTTKNEAIKIGVIDMNKVFMESAQLKEANAKFKKEFEGKEKKIIEARKKFKKTIEGFEKNSSVMDAAKKKDAEKKIIADQQALQKMQAEFQQKASNSQKKAMMDVSEEIRGVVEKIAISKKLDLVIAKAALSYNKEGLEITNDVIKKLKPKKRKLKKKQK